MLPHIEMFTNKDEMTDIEENEYILPCIDILLFEIRTRATAHIQLSPVCT